LNLDIFGNEESIEGRISDSGLEFEIRTRLAVPIIDQLKSKKSEKGQKGPKPLTLSGKIAKGGPSSTSSRHPHPAPRTTPESEREGGAMMCRCNAGEWLAVAGKPGRDHGGPYVQPTTTSPFFFPSHRKEKLGSRVLGLEPTTPTCVLGFGSSKETD